MVPFKFRAECMTDVARVLAKVHAGHVEIFCCGRVAGVPVPDVEVTITDPVFHGRMISLAELRRILSALPDGHVMAETLALDYEYTGERSYTVMGGSNGSAQD